MNMSGIGCKHPRQIGISLINGKNNCSQSILYIQRVLHLVIESHDNLIHHRDILGDVYIAYNACILHIIAIPNIGASLLRPVYLHDLTLPT